jgi:hypothetical protein
MELLGRDIVVEMGKRPITFLGWKNVFHLVDQTQR